MTWPRINTGNWFVSLPVLAWVIFAIVIWQPLLWPTFSATIMNDGDTPLYTSYALNLAQCPLAVSRGLMMNAIGPDCQSAFAGNPINYYLDHPPGMAWLLSPFVSRSEEPILAARWFTIMASLAMVLLCAAIAARARSPKCAIGVLLSSLLVPVFWWHAVSINLNHTALLFSVATVGAFLEQQRSGSRAWLVVSLLAFAAGCFVDWPAFFIAAPIGLRLMIQKQWKVFAAYLTTGVAMLALILAMLSGNLHSANQPFIIQNFLIGSFTGQFQKAAHILPLDQALVMSLRNTWRSLSIAALFLLVALAPLFSGVARRWFSGLYFLVLCFLVQGLLNQLLFIQWSATHNYWNYYYLPAALITGGILFENLVQRLDKLMWPVTLVLAVLAVGLFERQNLYWRNDYAQPPQTTREYLKAHGLENILASQAILFSNDQELFYGQGFKTRLDFASSARPLEQASDAQCDNVYLVFKNSTIDAAAKVRYSGGIVLDWYDWYVVPRNVLRTDCLSGK